MNTLVVINIQDKRCFQKVIVLMDELNMRFVKVMPYEYYNVLPGVGDDSSK